MYIVSGLKLIPQSKDRACWYASAQMLIQWKRGQQQMTLMDYNDPSEVKMTADWEVANGGITNPEIVKLAKALGLKAMPFITPTAQYLNHIIRTYGPLWTNGRAHIFVIGGIDLDREQFLIYDPWPVGFGKIEWRSFVWYFSGNAYDSRDKCAKAPDFLYHP